MHLLFTLVTWFTIEDTFTIMIHSPLYRLHLSESVSSLSLLSPLLFISVWGSSMDWGRRGCVERTGRHRSFTRCHPWLIGRGDFVARNASANMRYSLRGQDADGDTPSQLHKSDCVFLLLSSAIHSPHVCQKYCFWYHHRHIALQTAPNHWWRLVSLEAAYHMLAGHVPL